MYFIVSLLSVALFASLMFLIPAGLRWVHCSRDYDLARNNIVAIEASVDGMRRCTKVMMISSATAIIILFIFVCIQLLK